MIKFSIIFALLLLGVTCQTYDVIVIGTGTSGSVLCGEISSDIKLRVLCLENGYDVSDGTTEHISVNTPFSPSHALYKGVYNGQCENRKTYRRANAFGGGHSISGSASIRPSPEQYDQLYVPLVGQDWEWSRMEKILKWMENVTAPLIMYLLILIVVNKDGLI
jgi:choline dehydrogenase-like flavoprotein